MLFIYVRDQKVKVQGHNGIQGSVGKIIFFYDLDNALIKPRPMHILHRDVS